MSLEKNGRGDKPLRLCIGKEVGQEKSCYRVFSLT